MRFYSFFLTRFQLYRPVGIYVILVGIEIWTNRNKIEVLGEAHKTMNNFLEYRRTSISPRHPNDNAQLIIGETLGDGVVGKAPIMTICTWQYSGGVNMDHNKASGPVATTIAHEMGHNFGLNHDQSSCVCAHENCIMAPSSGYVALGTRNPTKWSSCSRDQFEEAFLQGMDYCLHNLPSEAQFSAKVCGNGFVEDGEECDCGLAQDCNTHCCNASTCKLNVNATCATGECCDLETCQVRAASYECRPQSQHCDLSEHCNGRSEYCPSDVHKADGHECSRDGISSYCYKGTCVTHDSQCKKLWGQTGSQSNALCYSHFNPMGLANGHCGFYFPTGKFEKCAASNVMCGMLHCEHRNEKLMFWKEALAYTLPEAWVMVNRSRHNCKSAILDVGLDMPDPGMVPDGAKCDEKKICVSQKCTAIEDLNTFFCPSCSGHGVCNSLGQCHCDAGWGPPHCNIVGEGGSEHSGPTTSNKRTQTTILLYSYIFLFFFTGNNGLIVGLCLFFLLILPLLVFLVYFGYWKREKLKKMWEQGPGHKYR
ncbi:hypothetical protein CAPTEDRAFT_107298 [Capitella teleta]|uniref:Disintegrin domain-containing protein n=1 Tax=Capitella teleta TaxID=283909 RepID=R7V4R2_CAPTE|nr:hypothetical protein CAPTEDRAFT_107298 [Capitella teleta]|eukprot:ELU13838.1 hypothetical protein CAPTEDRAFT_107298 [Capitella teleta]